MVLWGIPLFQTHEVKSVKENTKLLQLLKQNEIY